MSTDKAPTLPGEPLDDDSVEHFIEADTLATLRADHPRARYFLTDEGDHPIVFRPLKGVEFDRARKMLDDPKRKHGADERIARDIIVHPPKGELDGLFDDFPALASKVAALAVEIAKGEEPQEVKKLVPSSTARKRVSLPTTPSVCATCSQADAPVRQRPGRCSWPSWRSSPAAT